MKIFIRNTIVCTLIIFIVVVASISIHWSNTPSPQEIKQEARRASVQPIFDVPVLKVSFTTPLPQEVEINKEYIDDILKKQKRARQELREEISARIEKAILAERELQSKNRYETYLTKIDTHGVTPFDRNKIILGSLVPEWAKLPKRVLVVYRVEQKTITTWDNQYTRDILTISDLANVSPRIAKEIILKLRKEGYSVNKDEVDVDAEVELMWFKHGWSSNPVKLEWSVTLNDSRENLIKNYDPRGIIEIRLVPENRTVRVVAGYIDLLDKFKPKAREFIEKERKIEYLKNELERKEKQWREEREKLLEIIDEKTEDEEIKRDITTATLRDVAYGRVKLEGFWFKTAASGIFLGNKKVRPDMEGVQIGMVDVHNVGEAEKGFVLTNAHVAAYTINFEVYVSKDKEVMWIILPARASVRYTQNSDMRGSPAQLLAIDGRPVMSWDYDCAIMTTTKVPGYEHTVALGNSDKIQEGNSITMIGNPSMMQKFLTEGVVANTNYSLMKSHLTDRYLHQGIPRQSFNWLLNTNFWFDAPIGTGGTSGSGVWALEGSQKGKVIAIHHAGLSKPTAFSSNILKSDINNYFQPGNKRVKNVSKSEWLNIFKDPKEAKFVISTNGFFGDNPTFETIVMKGYRELSGLNAGIKINNIKRFLQERGLNPQDFGWEQSNKSYWSK